MKLEGIFAPLTTPFDADGSVARVHLRDNIALYNQTPLAGYVLTGSTGESVLLRWSEAYSIWETAKQGAAPDKILIAGTGAEATGETIEHTNRAAALGFDAALVRTPSFFKPAINDNLLAEHYLRVADASRIPIVLYSVPTLTHVTIEAPLVARVAPHPNIIGIKESSSDVEGLAKIVAAAPHGFATLVGSAAAFYESLERGAAGAVIALADVFPELCVELWRAARAGDSERARALQQELLAPAKLIGGKHGIGGFKYALDRAGYFGGAPRPPLLPLDEAARREIDAALARLLPAAVRN